MSSSANPRVTAEGDHEVCAVADLVLLRLRRHDEELGGGVRHLELADDDRGVGSDEELVEMVDDPCSYLSGVRGERGRRDELRDETNDRDESVVLTPASRAGGGSGGGDAPLGPREVRVIFGSCLRLDVLDHGLVESGEVLVPVLLDAEVGEVRGRSEGARSSKRAKKSAASRGGDRGVAPPRRRDISARTIARIDGIIERFDVDPRRDGGPPAEARSSRP